MTMDIYPNWPNDGKPQNENKEQPQQKSGMDLSGLLPLLMQMNGGGKMNPEMLSSIMGKDKNPMMGAMLASMMGNMGQNGRNEQKNVSNETPFPNSVKVEDFYKKK